MKSFVRTTAYSSIALPPHRNTLVGVRAYEMRGRTVGDARDVVRSEDEIVRTGAHSAVIRRQQAQSFTPFVPARIRTDCGHTWGDSKRDARAEGLVRCSAHVPAGCLNGWKTRMSIGR